MSLILFEIPAWVKNQMTRLTVTLIIYFFEIVYVCLGLECSENLLKKAGS